ncbi:hypothetical protein POKO110462_19430 [Pontibacter korlensis]|uniref:Uncharacterized protein n=1 Tax=Pontibacter korlensis TaxID=400092 RepID=A0A0E3UVL5_9BACT|nr:hypothetical protein [Pontibacter korlensis]AKD01941.1 hypothetical protein PKOR_00770 [Pontibacter korlensis]
MADNKNKKGQTELTKRNLASNANSQPNPEDYSNTANIKGGVDEGRGGTKATASQQQGQGSWSKNRHNEARPGSQTGGGGGGQGGNNPTGK